MTDLEESLSRCLTMWAARYSARSPEAREEAQAHVTMLRDTRACLLRLQAVAVAAKAVRDEPSQHLPTTIAEPLDALQPGDTE